MAITGLLPDESNTTTLFMFKISLRQSQDISDKGMCFLVGKRTLAQFFCIYYSLWACF